MDVAIPPKGSAVYVRYLDQSFSHALSVLSERETMGWLSQEVGPYINIQNDRTIEKIQYPIGSGSGILIPKESIIKIYLIEDMESE